MTGFEASFKHVGAAIHMNDTQVPTILSFRNVRGMKVGVVDEGDHFERQEKKLSKPSKPLISYLLHLLVLLVCGYLRVV